MKDFGRIHRRSVLRGGVATFVVASVGPVSFLNGGPAGASGDVFSRAGFERLLNRGFYVGTDAHPTLELIEVAPGPVAAGYDQFTLIFQGAPGASVDEAIQLLRPEGEGPMELFLSPAGSDADGSYFRADFCLTAFPGTGGCAGATGA